MRKRFLILSISVLLIISLQIAALPAFGQSYSFAVDQLQVDVFYEADGSARIVYQFLFSNDEFGPPIEFVDVGTPHSNFDLSSVNGCNWLDWRHAL